MELFLLDRFSNLNVARGLASFGALSTTSALFVGDDAFPLQRNFMRPYPGQLISTDHRIFHYWQLRAHRNCGKHFKSIASIPLLSLAADGKTLAC